MISNLEGTYHLQKSAYDVHFFSSHIDYYCSMGLFFDPDLKTAEQDKQPTTKVLSICNPQSPGKEWNTYLFNDAYTQLFELAGYNFVNDYFLDISQGWV